MARAFQTPLARRDLREIWTYVAADSVSAADRLVDAIIEKCGLLATQPEMGQRRPELEPRLRAFSVGNYVVFYRPVEDGIEVARVLHGARDVDRLF